MNPLKQLLLSAAVAALTLSSLPASAQPAAPNGPSATQADPFLWLEDIEGEKALDWARAENARSLPVLQGDPRYQGLFDNALKIITAQDRIPMAGFAGVGDKELRNYWQDKDHVRGIWRRTTMDSYRTATPAWETILDLDALSEAEGKNWVWKGSSCLPPDDRYCLVSLSDGGKDAVTVREYDTVEKRFVEGGFVAPEGKQNISWLDKDTLMIARDWGPGTMTKSSYPFVLGLWKRGQPLDGVKEIFRGTEDDISVSGYALRDPSGAIQAVFINRAVSFFESETYALIGGKPVKLPFPLKSSVQSLVEGRLVLTLDEDWGAQDLKQGDLVSLDLKALLADPAKAKAELVRRPTSRQSIQTVTNTANTLVVEVNDNVTGVVYAYRPGNDGWSKQKLNLPANSSLGIVSVGSQTDQVLASAANFLNPTTLWLANGGAPQQIKAAPAKFDADGMVIQQFEATSKDGTKVPYFIVHRKDIKLDGSNPTLQYAYGGFQVSMNPSYSGTIGKLWLERGGVYVLANIRGGGEFGPAWHQAGLKENRQRVYDDFFAVSEDLIARKITSPRRLGIMGGSNGGLLMGVALTQRPDLYNAVVIQVPLFDMQRYTVMGGAGASWAGEYGDGTKQEEWAYIGKYSPYQNIKPGQKYPEVYIETSTKDDRVHPGHARKAAAKLQSLGYKVLYYENIDGGHAASANLNETAMRVALEYSYLSRRLMD
ncbi:prolyl oligopeptidase family serine peptidase [Caulobacter sp. SLTY]|nr:prolyl oligopeptidase family serine peptidase [Caulobacter sp. SLTY]